VQIIVLRPATGGGTTRTTAAGNFSGAADRATHRLGARSVAVAEAGAALAWQNDGGSVAVAADGSDA
jgi:hypothetical protein